MKVLLIQPTYLPWSGYFGMIEKADLFIIYDNVQFVKQSWQQRNRIMTSDGVQWLTVPIQSKFGQDINEIKIDNKTRWWKKHMKSIVYSYGKSLYFDDEFINDIYNKDWIKLVDLNMYIIKKIMKYLHINTKIMLSSEINSKGKKTDRIIDILLKVNADEYITQYGTKEYIDPEKFRDNHIKLYWFDFKHPIYNQRYGNFVSYMSVIDMIFNCGSDSIKMIRSNSKLYNNIHKNMDVNFK